MNTTTDRPTTICHVLAIPYPGRGHINPMMSLCKLLSSQNNNIIITVVLTEEWLTLICSEAKPDNIRFATIPNVIPSELVRADDMNGFVDAVMTKMETPIEEFLDQVEPPPSLIVADTFLFWAVGVGNRRNIPVASFWTQAASVFSVFDHFRLFADNGDHPIDLLERGNDRVDYIPGVSSTRLVDFPHLDVPLFISGIRLPSIHGRMVEALTWVRKAQFLLLPTIYGLEPRVINLLRSKFSLPIYLIGPLIPNYLESKSYPAANGTDLQWLDSQPCSSVLYISMGSFLSISSAQMDEIAAGLRESGVRFIWVARGEAERLKEVCGDMGLVVPWCDQLRVLCHSSVGGYMSHCGWNSVREGVFAGVPFLTFPILMDQGMNGKMIVEDWRIGLRVKKAEVKVDQLVTREEIAEVVKKFMHLEDEEGKEMRRRARELKEICHDAIAEGGSLETNIAAFIRGISQGRHEQ